MMMYQFYLESCPSRSSDTESTQRVYYVDGSFYSRSSDIFLAGYWNMCQQYLLMYLLSEEMFNEYGIRLIPRTLHWTIGDCHIYTHQFEQVKELISRRPYRYYRLDTIDSESGPLIHGEYTPQTRITSTMAI